MDRKNLSKKYRYIFGIHSIFVRYYQYIFGRFDKFDSFDPSDSFSIFGTIDIFSVDSIQKFLVIFFFTIVTVKPKKKAMTNVYTLKDINNKSDCSFRGVGQRLGGANEQEIKENYIPLLNLKPKLMISAKS